MRFICRLLHLRAGNVVLYHVPGGKSGAPGLDVGVVTSVWKGIKAPRVVSDAVHVNSCSAFRVIALSLDHDKERSLGILDVSTKNTTTSILGCSVRMASVIPLRCDLCNRLCNSRMVTLVSIGNAMRCQRPVSADWSPWCVCWMSQAVPGMHTINPYQHVST